MTGTGKKQTRSRTASRKKQPQQPAASLSRLLHQTHVLLQQGREAEADRLFSSLVRTGTEDPALLNQMGVLAHMLGKSKQSLVLLRQSVTLAPTAPFYNNLGLVLEQTGDQQGASGAYQEAVRLDPDFPQAHYNLGNVRQQNLEFEGAIASYQQAVRLKPDYVAALNNLAVLRKKLGDFEEADSACRRALKIDPDYPEAVCTLCRLTALRGDPEKALAACKGALESSPRKELIYGALGDILAELGRKKEACEAYRMELSHSEVPGHVYYRMAQVKKYDPSDSDITEMEQRYNRTVIPEEKQFLCFALGKAYEDIGDYARAFGYIDEGNTIARAAYSYSPAEDRGFFRRLQNIFNARFFQEVQGGGHDDPTPVFVVGMPRSGTTLVEQILASHSNVYGAGERPDLARLIHEGVRRKGFERIEDGISELEPEEYRRIGAAYISCLRAFDAGAERIVDKMPHNFFWIGVITAALPQARIIHCRRTPLDTCWSLYKNIFDVPHKYAQDLSELGQYYRLYTQLMDHWQKMLPGKIYELTYEKLIQDQETETGKLLEHCGLAWEDSCLDFHRTQRQVLTSSTGQVRRPLYTSSINRWQSYGEQLKPLIDMIRRAEHGQK